ncbi:MAG TPA: mandelate racemase/muconate lactonizing enzyme family protein [Trueperaceae bacterium]|nr:mandelate racemase/muconate lactonizing enzyme family protein [Trueperaceae bacterium]
MKITRIVADEVVVPAHPGTINSDGMERPLHKLGTKGRPAWTRQFDEIPKLLLSMHWDDGTVGYGECYRDHDWSTVEAVANSLLGTRAEELTLQALPIPRCREYDGFECAVWDSVAKAHGLRVVDLLGGPVRERVKIGAWSGHRRTDEVGTLAERFSAAGFDCIKFKCDLEDDVAGWCREVAAAAPHMKVILDPNERWQHLHEARRRLVALAEVGNVLCVEDPIPRWRLDDYRELRAASDVPVVLHVSLPYFEHGQRVQDAILALTQRAVDGFNFNAGLAAFAQLDHVASAAQLPCWHGSELDLGILEAMYLHSCTAARSCTWPSDIFGRLIRSHDLLKQPLRIEPPYAWLPSGPGLGVEPDPEAVRAHRTRQEVYGQ